MYYYRDRVGFHSGWPALSRGCAQDGAQEQGTGAVHGDTELAGRSEEITPGTDTDAGPDARSLFSARQNSGAAFRIVHSQERYMIVPVDSNIVACTVSVKPQMCGRGICQ